MAGPAAGAKQDEFMKPAAMKILLNNADSKPVPCAIGEGAEPIMMVEKIGKPKKLLSTMLADARKRKTPIPNDTARFGMATLDPTDTSIIQVRVNKPVKPSIQVALRKTVKGIGFSEIVFLVDDKLDAEDEDAQENEGSEAESTEIPAPPPPPPLPAADAKALTAVLAQSMQQIPKAAAADPAAKDGLVALATAANGALKSGDLAAAAAAIGQLRQGINKAFAAAAAAPPEISGEPSKVVYAKSRLAWLAARKKVESDIEKLRQEIVATYKEEGTAGELEQAYRDRVGPVLSALDESLADKLDEATNETGATRRAERVGEAREIIEKYEAYLANSQTITDLDKNPFVALSIRATISATLNALSKAIH